MPAEQEAYAHTLRSADRAVQALDTEVEHIKLAQAEHKAPRREGAGRCALARFSYVSGSGVSERVG